MNKGLFIVCDGSNGAGKTTLIYILEQHLLAQGLEVVITREPGGTPIGEKIRDIILDKSHQEMTDLTELMLMAAQRAQHVAEKIKPALDRGACVISDRFDAATISFQHFARGIDLDTINTLNNLAKSGLEPDMNIILDLDAEIGMGRVKSRGDQPDRMEQEKLDFLDKARTGYLTQAKNNPSKFTVIDANNAKEQVANEAIGAIEKLLKK